MAILLDFPTVTVDDVASPPLVPDTQPIDRNHLFRMTLGDHKLECEVLQLFERQAAMLLSRMGEADPAGVAALAHTLRGSARGIGAWNVARAAEAVEVAAGARSVELQPAMNALSGAINDARRVIVALL
jgi:hypothetical protein